jgi:tellurite resistance protein TehA-like permease
MSLDLENEASGTAKKEHEEIDGLETFADNSRAVSSSLQSPPSSGGRVYAPVWMRLPNTSFGIPMGIAGQAIMWKAAGNAPFINDMINAQMISAVFWVASLLVVVILFTGYCMKAFFHFHLVKDEYNNSSRVHFMNMPHLIMLMLTISVPENTSGMTLVGGDAGRRIIFGLGFAIQVLFTQRIYESWLFSDTHNISCARPQFLLSTVGWFFLANLGAQTNIEAEWGIALPTFCFGFGLMLYFMVAIAIFNAIHFAPQAKGSPALFLLIAPPSIGVVATDLIIAQEGEFPIMSQLLLGWCLGLFMLLIRIGPKILKPPPALGAYWAYVFPMSALATALIRYAIIETTRTTEVLALTFVVFAVIALVVVFIRTSIHEFQVFSGNAEWGDPLLSRDSLVSVKTFSYTDVIDEQETA